MMEKIVPKMFLRSGQKFPKTLIFMVMEFLTFLKLCASLCMYIHMNADRKRSPPCWKIVGSSLHTTLNAVEKYGSWRKNYAINKVNDKKLFWVEKYVLGQHTEKFQIIHSKKIIKFLRQDPSPQK